MANKRLLITGVSGLLGSNLAYALRGCFDLTGVYNQHAVTIDGGQTVKADLRDGRAVEVMLENVRPDIVLHGAAQADVDRCDKEPAEAHAINVDATKNLVDALRGTSTKLVYISTDLVYSGEGGACRETDKTVPRNQYAHTKLEGERVALWFPGTLALRTNFFGRTLFEGKRSLAEWLIGELTAGRTVKGFTDAIFSTIYTLDIAILLERLLRMDAAGIYNLGSRNALSKYDFLVCLAKSLGFKEESVFPVSMDSVPARAPRSKNLALDVSKLQSAVGDVPTIEQTIEHFARDDRQGMPQALHKVVSPFNAHGVVL